MSQADLQKMQRPSVRKDSGFSRNREGTSVAGGESEGQDREENPEG